MIKNIIEAQSERNDTYREKTMEGYNILIVDDSKVTRQVVRAQPFILDQQIKEANDGIEALDLTRTNDFDLVITDISMPKMDGFSFCQKLKEDIKTRSIPVIILSAFDTEEDIQKSFELGAAAFISKDDIKSQLSNKSKEVLSKSIVNNKRHILVVDDSPCILQITEEALAQSGYNVVTKENGEEALKALTKQKPDLILSDINMPVMDGFTFCRSVHSIPEFSSIPFVVMSTESKRVYMQRMLNYGANAYLVKPFNLNELTILIDKLLSDHYLLLLNEKKRLDLERINMVSSVISLVEALEARDLYTKGHSEDVSEILAGMATVMGFSSSDKELIVTGGKLHDIGKIGVQDSVLQKPGELTNEEYEHIKKHPVIGANILKPIGSLKKIIPIVLNHHERYDGTGYPEGLKGEKLELWARMVGVADMWNALITDRPYRKGMPYEKALHLIKTVRGTQLCPECVDVFLSWQNSNKDLFKDCLTLS